MTLRTLLNSSPFHCFRTKKRSELLAYLDHLVSAGGEQTSCGGLVVQVHDGVLAVVEGGRGGTTEWRTMEGGLQGDALTPDGGG